MKKRILLSLVSFFMMTAMWASLIDAYQIYVTAAANGKTGATAELTLNMKNKTAVHLWSCRLVLPEGVTFESAELLTARVPEGYEAEFNYVVNADGSVTLSCEGAEGVDLTGTDGAIAKVVVNVAATAPVGDCFVYVKDATMKGDKIWDERTSEFAWSIEQGAVGLKGDVNNDDMVTIADAVSVLNAMAGEEVPGNADVNGDGLTSIADFVTVLNIMAGTDE